MFPNLSILSHVPSSIHEHIRDGVYDRAVWEHNHIVSNVLPSHVGILQCVHPESGKIMQIASTLYKAIRANVVVVAGYKSLFMELFCRTLLRRFFGQQSSAARSFKNSRHVRKFFVYVQPWVFDDVVVGARLYNSNLEDKVLIGAGGYGSGLCIGLSRVYFRISTGNMKWIERIVEELEHKIVMRRRKKQQRNLVDCSSEIQ
ncbi:hypothetical protein CQW23_31449 [Capsicum baccatum]|uniref:Uncharacterized protein n=1 Tax=Capsicum baccatum TaxID=33114 RepID=A0A2G2V7W3_CAPBA|nr:hypothetical protein CQW23_31449 [Capsicum baccatum]